MVVADRLPAAVGAVGSIQAGQEEAEHKRVVVGKGQAADRPLVEEGEWFVARRRLVAVPAVV